MFAEREPGVFGNTEASALLCADSSGSWPEVAHLFGDVFYGAVATMDPRSPAETFPAAYGEGFWSWLEQHPVERAIFDAAMAGGKEGNAVRLAELEWRDGDTVATRVHGLFLGARVDRSDVDQDLALPVRGGGGVRRNASHRATEHPRLYGPHLRRRVPKAVKDLLCHHAVDRVDEHRARMMRRRAPRHF